MRKVFTIIVLQICFLVLHQSIVRADSEPTAEPTVRTLTLQGLTHAYNLNFDLASQKFENAIALDPHHPRPWLGKASIPFWNYLLGRQETDLEAFRTLANSTIEVASTYLEERGDNADVHVCLGMIYGYLAFAEARTKEYLSSAWHGKKSYDHFRSAVELDSAAYDAYLGLGVYHYFAAFLPRTLRWIVSILGVESNSELGVHEMRLAATRGTYARYEARYYLAQFLPWYNGDFQTSERMLAELLNEFPSNGLFAFTLAVWQVRKNDVRSAQKVLEPVVDDSSRQLPGVKRYAFYKLAECYYRLEEHDRAVDAYRRYLSGNTEEMYRATALYRLAVSLERLGRRGEAIRYYQRAADQDHGFGDDRYSARHARRRIQQPLSPEDVLLLRAQNSFKCGDYEDSRTTYAQFLQKNSVSSDLRAEASYGLGETLFEQKLYDEALSWFMKAATIETGQETWIHPWSHYHMAQCYQKLKQPDRAREELAKVSGYDDYDFDAWLTFRTERELTMYNEP